MSGAADGSLRVWSLSTGACVETISAPFSPSYGVAVLKGGTQIVVSGDVGFVGIVGF